MENEGRGVKVKIEDLSFEKGPFRMLCRLEGSANGPIN